jgi:hypothetical protein
MGHYKYSNSKKQPMGIFFVFLLLVLSDEEMVATVPQAGSFIRILFQ